MSIVKGDNIMTEKEINKLVKRNKELEGENALLKNQLDNAIKEIQRRVRR